MSNGGAVKSDAPRPVWVDPHSPQKESSEHLIAGEKPIGIGGMSTIKKVLDRNLMTELAMKVLDGEFVDHERNSAHFVEEAQITAQLQHPNIIPIHELGINDQGHLFFTMKLVQGKTLTEILKEQDFNNRDINQLYDHLQIFLKVCSAVAFAHSRGVIHRDLKPDNIMVGEHGEIYVMDWGIAKLNERVRPSENQHEMQGAGKERYERHNDDGIVVGTAEFISPEQARGENDLIDERTDIFCLGGILYQILTNTTPYQGENPMQIIYRAMDALIKPPHEMVTYNLPPGISRIAMKALQKDPNERYQTVSEFEDEVKKFLQSGWQFERCSYAKGSLIVREKEQGNQAYVIVSGRCLVYKTIDGKKVPLQEIAAGDVFGETAVFADVPRTASVEAMEPTSVVVITREHLEADLGINFWLGRFVKALGKRFKEKDQQLTALQERFGVKR